DHEHVRQICGDDVHVLWISAEIPSVARLARCRYRSTNISLERRNGERVKTLLVTGGAGFIGSALVRMLVRGGTDAVVNVDKLTYAGNLDSLIEVSDSAQCAFEHVDISDGRGPRAL